MSYEMSVLGLHRGTRIMVLSVTLCLVAGAPQLLRPAHADPPPCDALITVPKPPPVPFPSPKPSPVSSGSISGAVGGSLETVIESLTETTVTLYRCQGTAGVEVGSTTAGADGGYSFSNLDAGYDYYVEAAFLPSSLFGPLVRIGAYAVPGMQDVNIGAQ